MTEKPVYYVYVYIDPRNFEEFYYGKGTRDRMYSHLHDKNVSEKTERIEEIRKIGLKPIIKVVAKGLIEHEALLIEKTLIWKLGRNLTNVSPGHFANNFRPLNTMHLELEGFDYENGIYLLNAGEGIHRSWDDCRKHGFMSAGQGKRWSGLMKEFKPSDIIAAYWSRKGFKGGYVGVGVVNASAIPVKEFTVNGQSLRALYLTQPNIFENCDSQEKSEWVVAVNWIATVPSEECKWQSKIGLFSTPSTKASLEKQVITLDFLEREFHFKFADIRK
jgi:uncharacterized protein